MSRDLFERLQELVTRHGIQNAEILASWHRTQLRQVDLLLKGVGTRRPQLPDDQRSEFEDDVVSLLAAFFLPFGSARFEIKDGKVSGALVTQRYRPGEEHPFARAS